MSKKDTENEFRSGGCQPIHQWDTLTKSLQSQHAFQTYIARFRCITRGAIQVASLRPHDGTNK